ncbi:hypothetical protein EMIT0P201_80056 [Pseudomonas chlororaphis]
MSVKFCWNTPSASSRYSCWSSTYSSRWKWPSGCFPVLAPSVMALHLRPKIIVLPRGCPSTESIAIAPVALAMSCGGSICLHYSVCVAGLATCH